MPENTEPTESDESAEQVLGLQETESDEEDVQAHSAVASESTYSVTVCTKVSSSPS